MESMLYKEYTSCRLCPRQCAVDRTQKTGACGMGSTPYVARAALHTGEEPVFGTAGAVFFSGCSLSCVYCQNHAISHGRWGRPVDTEALAEIYLSLEAAGADTLDLVTPTHFRPHVTDAVLFAKKKGLSIPVVYNTSGYETPEAIRALDGAASVFLADYRYASPTLAARYSHAADYPEVAIAAIEEMLAVTGEPQFDTRGIMTRGTLVRLLLLPGAVIDMKRRLHTLHRRFGNRIVYSLLRQYTPPVGMPAPLDRTVTDAEYVSVLRDAEALGLRYAFTQGKESATDTYLPAFDGTGVPETNRK